MFRFAFLAFSMGDKGRDDREDVPEPDKKLEAEEDPMMAEARWAAADLADASAELAIERRLSLAHQRRKEAKEYRRKRSEAADGDAEGSSGS